ncbi:hypothetical protein EPA93_07815 [Ktedonosporobacter rubrisoli]|uniref:Uncharacterized protein n=1 Tax=Ktedonosporobacter rubrisoli TaxID=2509675 RepID=A0A4P6JLL9_KTERU|nr:hypothetical protein EPA93_07815 [Ktedonosporobacter rubrisoli]
MVAHQIPWLHCIEPKWVHGKRAIVEPTRLLTTQEVRQRVGAIFAVSRLNCSHKRLHASSLMEVHIRDYSASA